MLISTLLIYVLKRASRALAAEAAFHLLPASCRAWDAASQLPLLHSLAQQPPKFHPWLEQTHFPHVHLLTGPPKQRLSSLLVTPLLTKLCHAPYLLSSYPRVKGFPFSSLQFSVFHSQGCSLGVPAWKATKPGMSKQFIQIPAVLIQHSTAMGRHCSVPQLPSLIKDISGAVDSCRY